MTAAALAATPESLRDRTGDLRQIASVRGITLTDGPERGLRALAFSTGGGLDFWVLLDRSMDIGPLWYAGTPVAWQHPTGFVAPDLYTADSDAGTGIERVLSGFLVTCGLEHVRQPAGSHPLHGRFPLTPARLLSRGEDWAAPTPTLHAEAEVTSAHVNGAAFRLVRRIEAPIGGRSLSLSDRVENIGPESQPLALLYHFNFGFPAVDARTDVRLNGELQPELAPPVTAASPTVRCLPAGSDATATVELTGGGSENWSGVAATLRAPTSALPFVQFWSDPRPRRNILAVEPATCDRASDGSSRAGPVLAPAENWLARIDINFDRPAKAALGP